MSVRVRIKVCCISSVEEATTAVRLGADALGLVSHMPSGPGVIDESLIHDIARCVPPPVATFLLTSHQDTDVIIEQQRRCRVNTLQLVDALPEGSHAKLRKALPGVSLVQVLHVRDDSTIEEARAVQHDVDALLLDSGNPDLAVKELGGTGRVHNWEVSRQLIERSTYRCFSPAASIRRMPQKRLPRHVPLASTCARAYAPTTASMPDKLAAFIEAVRQAR